MLSSYQRRWLRGDLVAGVTVAAYLVPQVMAYATVAGVAPVVGLWAALPALVVYPLLGSSRSLSMGPEATTALMTAIAIGPLAAGHSQRYAALAASLALLVGVMALAAWLLRLGFVADLLSRPVLVGYMAGLALIMIADQLQRVTGIPVTGQSFTAQAISFSRSIGELRPATALVSAAVLAFLLLVRWRWPHAPGSLLALLLATAFVAVSDLTSRGIGVVGTIPAALPVPALPDIHPHDLRLLLLPAFTVLIVGFSDDVLTARSFARRGEEIRPNQELLALAAANAGSSLLRGFPVSSSATRTSIGIAAGSRTQLYSLTAAASALAVLLFLRPVLARFPTAALGAIVIYAAIRLVDLTAFRRLLAFRRSEFLIALAACVGVLAFNILYGVLVAIGLSVADLLVRVARPHAAILGLVPGLAGMHNVDDYPGARTVPGLVVLPLRRAVVLRQRRRLPAPCARSRRPAAAPRPLVRAQCRGQRRGGLHRARSRRCGPRRAQRGGGSLSPSSASSRTCWPGWTRLASPEKSGQSASSPPCPPLCRPTSSGPVSTRKATTEPRRLLARAANRRSQLPARIREAFEVGGGHSSPGCSVFPAESRLPPVFLNPPARSVPPWSGSVFTGVGPFRQLASDADHPVDTCRQAFGDRDQALPGQGAGQGHHAVSDRYLDPARFLEEYASQRLVDLGCYLFIGTKEDAEQIPAADDADQLSGLVNHGQTPDAMAVHQPGGRAERSVRVNCDNRGCHQVGRAPGRGLRPLPAGPPGQAGAQPPEAAFLLADHVGLRHHADHAVVLGHHGDGVDLLLSHDPGDLLVRGRLADRHHVCGHNVTDPPAAAIRPPAGLFMRVFVCCLGRFQGARHIRCHGLAVDGLVIGSSQVAEHRVELRFAVAHIGIPSRFLLGNDGERAMAMVQDRVHDRASPGVG